MPAIFVINKNTLIDIIISSVAKTLILSSGPQGFTTIPSVLAQVHFFNLTAILVVGVITLNFHGIHIPFEICGSYLRDSVIDC